MDKIFENLVESKWIVRGLALVLALLLYATAFIDEQGTTNPSANNNMTTETIEDVPVVLEYNKEDFVVTGAPEFVDVIVEGNNSFVQSAKNLRDFVVFIDLTNAQIGSQQVMLQIRDISDRLTVRIEPAAVVVNVQEKVTEEFAVEVEFNQSLLEEGYKAETPVIEPRTVQITGGKDVIESISYVKAIIESDEKIDETFTQQASISVLDKNLNKLFVTVEPATVDVTIPVISPTKNVSVSTRQVGTPREGIIIQSIEPAIEEIVLSGPKNILDEITNVQVPVDISGVEGSTELTVPIELPEGVTATPESIVVQVVADVEEAVEIANVPIEYLGLEEGAILEFLNPETGQVNMVVRGPSKQIGDISPDDIRVTIDVNGLREGEHEVDLLVEGPEGFIFDPEVYTATVMITQED